MTYIVVFRKNNNGKTDYGICGAYSNKSDAEAYIQSNQAEGVTFTVAEIS